ncbi:MAG: hypothetical protein VKK04_21145, partial [Synechococcales bacterium]|nr:hypothetical protein [Synechococcales bacterium]
SVLRLRVSPGDEQSKYEILFVSRLPKALPFDLSLSLAQARFQHLLGCVYRCKLRWGFQPIPVYQKSP